MQILSPVKSLKEGLLDFLFPKTCLICSERIDEDSKFTFLCKICYFNLPTAPSSNEILDRLLSTFDPDDIAISDAFSLFSLKENNFLEVIHTLKYQGFYKIGVEFGRELGNKINSVSSSQYDAIIPVPIHSAKQRERGYNQSFLIAEGVSESLGVKVDNRIVLRTKYTKSQTTLNAAQRKANILNVYKTCSNSSLIQNKTFLLIDDVFTTGSTINLLALSLLEAGSRKIDCATLGIA